MPEYLAPGVYIEETSFRSKSIEGVGTSVAAIAGPTRSGPIRGTPEVVTSYSEFERIYGDPASLTFGSASPVLNHTALAARAFFENGGKQLFVSRVVSGGNGTDAVGGGSSAATASATSTGGVVSFSSRFPGSGGNLDLEVIWEDSQNLLKTQTLGEIADSSTAWVSIVGNIEGGDLNDTGSHGGFPLKSLKALVTRSGDNWVFVAGTNAEVINNDETSASVAVADLGSSIIATAVADTRVSFTQITSAQPASGALTAATPAELVLATAVDITALSTGDLGALRVVRGTINASGDQFTVSDALNDGIGSPFTFYLSALAAVPGSARSLTVQRNFGIDVIRRKTSSADTTGTPGVGEPIYQISGLSLDPADTTSGLAASLPQNPQKKLDALTLPITSDVANGATTTSVHEALFSLFAINGNQLTPPNGSFDEPRYVITISGGSDGDLPVAIDYSGETDEIKGSTGLAAFEEVEDISIVMTPAAAADSNNHQAIVAEVQKHCAKMRYRVGIVDSRQDMAISEVRAFRDNFDDSRLVLYYPWVVTSDPTGAVQDIAVPPSGFIAGIYARTDVNRGVHKAPANTAVFGALRFNQDINKFQQELLNPSGINCLRSFPGRGHRIWGGRTLSSDPEWKYVNVRRYFLFLERSIEKGTQWAVFEPNGEQLWANVATTIEGFLFNEWTNGRLLGSKPEAAYFVRCDRSTMTQNDIDNGRLICEVGVAPLRPAEFVIFRIGQKTADA